MKIFVTSKNGLNIFLMSSLTQQFLKTFVTYIYAVNTDFEDVTILKEIVA